MSGAPPPLVSIMDGRRRQHIIAAITAAIALGLLVQIAGADDGPKLYVDVTADRHAINPDIYGMAYPDPALAAEIRLPIVRWGGDGTTRYNWQIDQSNAGDDWFFIAGGRKSTGPSGGPDAMVNRARADGGRALLTVPIIDYINKSVRWDCSFPVSIFGKQQKVNPYVHPTVDGARTDAGNGRTPDGKPILLTDEQKLRINMLNTPEFEQGWIRHLVQQFGTAAHGGVPIYELDNEPGGWNNTHRDVHPGQTGDDELVSRSIKYAEAVKAVDPSALILGPGDFVMHYQSDGKPGDGKKEHDGLGQGDYYLQQMRAYQKQHGRRLLDYFDEHYYPIGQQGENDEVRLEASRSLWDPTYVEKNWIGKWHGAIALIPAFHKWVDTEYPGTKVSISEYGWGDGKTLVGALGEMDVLGIFGRERLDLACLFGPPIAGDAAANAFRMYRNYDGKGGRFGDTAVHSKSADQSRLAIYGAERQGDHVLTLIVINKSRADLTTQLSIIHTKTATSAKVFRYSNDNPNAVVAEQDQPVDAAGFSATFPSRSATLFVVGEIK
jgi:hypothetical protein